jgi:ketoreductase RED1
MRGLGAQTAQIELGTPSTDPAVVAKMVDDSEAVYGVGEEVYQQLAAKRDRRTKAVLKAPNDTP